MATKKDMRRPELVVPYVEPPAKVSDVGDMSSTMSNTMPMAAMFSRNKMIAWASVTFSLQNWLAETPEQQKKSTTPAYMGVIMAFLSVAVTYMPMFLPTPGKPAANVAAPPPVPSS
ncbi:translation initiation factor 1 [Blastomyces parvus]|uniref:Translation initiation factor 1 n=1 Tax=Blastomyces parvus TaxID=2060905 RepID=A0A2B7XLM5_9EURO|nr:translation initiation factor 1 [Blastomyces parvus]